MHARRPIISYRSLLTPSWTPSCDWPTYHTPSSSPASRRPTASGGSGCSRHRRWSNTDDHRVARRRHRDGGSRPVTTGAAWSDRCPATPTPAIGQRPRSGAPTRPRYAAKRRGTASGRNAGPRPSTVWNGPPATSTFAYWTRSRQRCPSPTDAAALYGVAASRRERVETPATAMTSTQLRLDSLEKDGRDFGLRIPFGLRRISRRTRRS